MSKERYTIEKEVKSDDSSGGSSAIKKRKREEDTEVTKNKKPKLEDTTKNSSPDNSPEENRVKAFQNDITHEKEEDIFESAKEGDIERIKELLNTGVDVNKCDNRGWTALHHAVHAGNIEVINFLITNNADINFQDNSIIEVVKGKKSLEIAKLLIDAGADPTIQDNEGNTALHNIYVDDPQLAQIFMTAAKNKGKNILNIDNNFGKTPIDYAIESGYHKILKHFINSLAKVDPYYLHTAAYFGNMSAINILREYVDINHVDDRKQNVLDYAYAGIEDQVVKDHSFVQELSSMLGKIDEITE